MTANLFKDRSELLVHLNRFQDLELLIKRAYLTLSKKPNEALFDMVKETEKYLKDVIQFHNELTPDIDNK